MAFAQSTSFAIKKQLIVDVVIAMEERVYNELVFYELKQLPIKQFDLSIGETPIDRSK